MEFLIEYGNDEVKNKLIEFLNSNVNEDMGLEEFLSDLNDTIEKGGDYFVAFENEIPRGAISVIDKQNISYLQSMWTRTETMQAALDTTKELVDAWISNIEKERYVADLPHASPIGFGLLASGFHEEKSLFNSYEVKCDYSTNDENTSFRLVPFNKSWAYSVYNDLILNDIPNVSPLFISYEQFNDLIQRTPDENFKSWTIALDNDDELVGFGASMMIVENNKMQPVLYGPHGINDNVVDLILSEMLSYWKMNNVDKIKIMRTNPFPRNIIKKYDMKLKKSITRYVYDL